jgi:haloacetate dehalogenase
MPLFPPAFIAHWIDTSIGKIFARKGGTGSPLLLIHGFPQTHVEWHKMAGELAKTHMVIMPDLPGYGWSAAPRDDVYSKREMAKVMLEVMHFFEVLQFSCMGHDRGARVAYRLALDHPGRISKLVVIDIIPTFAMWEKINAQITPKNEHWLKLASPNYEAEIKKDPVGYLEGKLALWSGTGDLSPYHKDALQAYREFIQDPSRIHAVCEDYRAGKTQDLAADLDDLARGIKIGCPVLSLWGTKGIPDGDPLVEWRKIAGNVTGQAIAGGHFLPEENPEGVLAAVVNFL